MKTQTKINKQSKRKSNPELVETIIAAKKSPFWKEIAEKLSSPKKMQLSLNVDEIDGKIETNKTNVLPGKILSMGEIKKGNKKTKIVALRFSESAKEKLLNSGYEISYISEEIKNNPEGKNTKIIK